MDSAFEVKEFFVVWCSVGHHTTKNDKKVIFWSFFGYIVIFRGQNGRIGHSGGFLKPDPHLFEVVSDGYDAELACNF